MSTGLRSRRMKVRALPSALMRQVIVSTTFALVAQPEELPPLKREAAGSIPAGCTGRRERGRDGQVDLIIPRGGLRAVVAKPGAAAAGGAGGAALFPATAGIPAAGKSEWFSSPTSAEALVSETSCCRFESCLNH